MNKSSSQANMSEINIGGVNLSHNQVQELYDSTRKVNKDGNIVIPFILDLDSTFNQKSYNESVYNLTGIEPFNGKHNLTYSLQQIAGWWSPENRLKFEKIEYNSSISKRDFLQVALCPSLKKAGFTTTYYKRNQIKGARICLRDTHTGTFSHEIGHILGLNHPDEISGLNEAFAKAGLDIEKDSVMNSFRSKESADKPSEFDQDLLSFGTFNHDLNITTHKHLPNSQSSSSPTSPAVIGICVGLASLPMIAIIYASLKKASFCQRDEEGRNNVSYCQREKERRNNRDTAVARC